MENKRKKQTLGRQKIEIKKIETNSNLQVTFSKRRAGLFKKAAELSLLCGSDVAAFVNSPTGKVYAFSNLPVDVLLDRYLNQTAPSSSSSLSSLLPFSGPTGPLHEVAKKKYMEVKAQLEVEEERERRKAAVTMVVAEGGGVGGGGDGFWWDQPTEGLGLQELEQYVAAMEEMKKKVVERAEELAVASASPSNLLISAFITEASTEENSLDFERKFY